MNALLLWAALSAAGAEERIEVTVVGVLHTGVVAIGGETTGATITAKGITWELELGEHAQKAESLDGKRAVVSGELERRQGVEVKERWIVKVDSLAPAETPQPKDGAARHSAPPVLTASVRRKDAQVRFAERAGATVVEIKSKSGIGEATIARTGRDWPLPLIVRAHLSGLESFKLGKEGQMIEWSADREPGAGRATVLGDKTEEEIDPGDPLYTKATFIPADSDAEKACFEIPLPEAFFADNPQRVTLSWVDFYR